MISKQRSLLNITNSIIKVFAPRVPPSWKPTRCVSRMSPFTVQIPEARPQPSMRDDARSLVIDGLDDRPSIIRFAQTSRLFLVASSSLRNTSSLSFFFFFFSSLIFFFLLFFCFFFLFFFFFSSSSNDVARWYSMASTSIARRISSSFLERSRKCL